MSNLQSFNLVSHYTGRASTANPVNLSILADFAGSSGSPQSFVQWRPAKQTTAADKRFFRSFDTQSFAYLISLTPTTPEWQTRLSEIEIGYTRFVRPNHVHCVPGVSPLSLSGLASSGLGDTDLTVRDPAGNAIPNAIVVCRRRSFTHTFTPNSGASVVWTGYGRGNWGWTGTSDTVVAVRASASGVATNVLNTSLGPTVDGVRTAPTGNVRAHLIENFDTITVYDSYGVWVGVVDLGAHAIHNSTTSYFSSFSFLPYIEWFTLPVTPAPATTFPSAQSRSIVSYLPSHSLSNSIKGGPIWPQKTFTSWGAAYVQADRDWMPRVVVRSVSAGAPVEFDASMTLWRVGNSRLDLPNTIYGITATADATRTLNLAAPTAPFAFSRHESLPPGLYWRASSYPGSYATGAARWSAVPGSNVTGYTAPAEEPSCPFVVKTGTI
jgi:hypothetical protein